MFIIPAIDLKDGQCVRLLRGDFNQKTIYSDDPISVAGKFVKDGARWLHVVDLDGAEKTIKKHDPIVKELTCTYPDLKIETGGGIRSADQIKYLLDIGVERVILGSMVVDEPEIVKEFLKTFGTNRIVLALDVRVKNGISYVLTRGWQDESSKTLNELIYYYYECYQNLVILCTDISRDGTLEGPAVSIYKDLKSRYEKIKVIASGGVSSMNDLIELKEIKSDYAIIGKAIYENKIDLKEAILKFEMAS